MPTVIATIKVKEDKIEEAKQALKSMAADVLESEAGTLAYQFHQRKDEPTLFVAYEKYETEEAFAEHSKNLPARAGGLAGLLAGAPEIIMLEEI
jgi:quinol monooxygenase YgiN